MCVRSICLFVNRVCIFGKLLVLLKIKHWREHVQKIKSRIIIIIMAPKKYGVEFVHLHLHNRQSSLTRIPQSHTLRRVGSDV